MNHWTEILYFSIFGAALVSSFVGLLFTAVMPGIDRWSKRFFSHYYIVFLLCCLAGLMEMAVYYFPVPGTVLHGIILLESMLLPIPLPMLTVFLLHCCGEDTRSGRLFHIVIGLVAVYFLMLLSSLFTGSFFYISQDGHFCRGPLYPLCPLPLIAVLLCNLAGTIRRRKQISHKVFLAFLIAILPIMAAMIAQLFFDFFPVVDISYVLSALAMYGFILSNQIEQDRRHQGEIALQHQEIALQQREIALQQQEIAHERASIMVLQMRPHFIYNTLMTIHSLCRLDPQKARQIIIDFTNYLRRNFNAVASDSAIPFSTELEHTRAYLAVEQAQYDDMLVVTYDTPFISFRLPPLTLQPIVENAVKHGMDPYSGPLRILVRTRHTDSVTEILVEDNGPGFDPSDPDKPHPTLTNIRQRLHLMCGGQLSIAPAEGRGIAVTITIPDSADPAV